MITRRKFLLAFGVVSLFVVSPAFGQQERHVRRIGFLNLTTVQTSAAWLAAFREGMAELQWVEKRDYVIDARYANGVEQAGPVLAAELVATHPDLMLTTADTPVRLLSQRTKTIPIVSATCQDPVGNGFAASLRRPGGNITGLTTLTIDLAAKRLQLLKEAFPRVAHVALLFQQASTGSLAQVKEIEEAAARLGTRVTAIGLQQAADIDAAFKRGAAAGAHAYMTTSGPFIVSQLPAIVDRIFRSKVPAMFERGEFVEAGGLMSYSASFRDNFRRAAAYADKILKGAKPGELPIEQPTKFELMVNLKTARAMDITIPQSFLMRADRVIQ